MAIVKFLILSCVLMCSILKVSNGSPRRLRSTDVSISDAKNFLAQYGYLPIPLYRPGMSDTRDFSGALTKFQAFSGLPETGMMDDATLDEMDKPRCGFPDVANFGTSRNKWENDITYRIDVYTRDLSRDLVQQEIRRAWKVWADVTPLTITEVSANQQADIVIKFQGGDHNDGYPFDGRSGVLAHAFFPRVGICHLDEAETWTVGTSSGTNLFLVAVHEFGHNLGLQHSNVRSAIMYPTYPGYRSNFRLGSDDIQGIQSIYGPPRSGGSGSGSSGSGSSGSGTGSSSGGSGTGSSGSGSGSGTSPQQPPTAACSGVFQTVVKTTDGTFYGFTGGYVWDLTNRLSNGLAKVSGTTSLFHSALNSRPGPQAALTINDKTYIFKGCAAWRFYNTRFETIVNIGDYWRGLPCNINAAFKADDGFTYFFLGQYVYTFLGFNLQNSGPISSLGWRNFPTDLTSIDAISPSGNSNNDVYIYSGDKYWKMNQSSETIYARYPRNTVSIWFPNCSPM